MVKQYVGARYVPKFASPVAWAANTSYEALTIVTFNNASYTSKVPVPPTVGNPADNPDYWALTGNYNAQVEQYRQETETVSNNLTTLQDQVTTEITNRAYVTPQMYGAVGNGVADDTIAIQTAIDTGKPVYVPDGTYVISAPLTWTMPCRLKMSTNAIIKAKADRTLSCLLGIRNDGTVYSNAENEYINGGIFDGNYCCDVVIGINYCRGKISDCTIQGVKNVGLYIRHNLTNEGVGRGSLRVLDVIVKNTRAATGTIGIYSAGNDNYIRAITQNMEIGISANAGETLESCHAWISSSDIFENSTAFVVRGLYCILSNCTSDTMRYGVKINSGGGRLNINGFLYYHNTAVATASILASYQCVVFNFASGSMTLISNAVINLANAVAKVVSDNVIGSKLVKVTNLITAEASNAVSANIPNDIASYADTVINSYSPQKNITQDMIDNAILNTVISGYIRLTGLEGWAIVITIGRNDQKVQAIIIQGKGTFVRRYSSGAWDTLS